MKKCTLFIICFLNFSVTQQLFGMKLDWKPYSLLSKLDAAQNDQEELSRLLRNADPNSVSSSGRSILQHASHRNKTQVVAALLKAKADPNYIDKENRTALSLHCTGFAGKKTDCIPLLLEAKADVNLHHQYPDAVPALHVAIDCQNFAAITRLIAAGADTSTALEYARECYNNALKNSNSNRDPIYLYRTKGAAEIVSFFEKFEGVAAQAGPAPEQEEKEEEDAAMGAKEEDAPSQYEDVVPE